MTLRTIRFDDEQWQVVPREPTPEMLRGQVDRSNWNGKTGEQRTVAIYKAILAVAPEPPAQEPEPAAYMYQHDETGRTTFREPHERMNERRWQEFPLYRHLPSEDPMTDDTRRLDHLIQSGAFRVLSADMNGNRTWTGVGRPIGEGATVRDAIDNSIKRHHGIGKGESNEG